MKNRPFYTGDPVETVLVEETTIPFEHKNPLAYYVGGFASTFLPIVGETYKVSWDGTVHECICEDFNGLPVIGNLSIPGFGSDSGEPFIIVVEDHEVISIATADTSASHTISISGIVTPVVKIDPKYIRDMYYTADPVETVFVEESTVAFVENNAFYMAEFETTFVPTVGETYKVSWDGSVYESTCLESRKALVIGNLSIVGEGSDTGEPFLIGIFNVGRIQIATQNTSASHTISISGRTTQVVKIDEKYLPDTVATKSDVEAVESIANNARSTANNAQSTANNAVKYTASQNLTDAQKQQARTNIGAGTSSFSGNYNDLANKPTIVQGDWDVNNDADMAYIKNRTHYTEINTEAIVEKHILYYKSVEGDKNVSSLSYILASFRNLGIPDTFNIAQGDNLKIDRYREPTNSQYPYVDTIYGELTKITGKNGYDYVYYVFGNAYLFKNVTDPVLPIDISSDYDNGITYAGFIEFAYYNGELFRDNSVICLMVPTSMVGPNVFDISILSSTIHMLDEKYIPKTVQRVGDDVILSSSTEGSTKKFKITVDDTGTLSATEVT